MFFGSAYGDLKIDMVLLFFAFFIAVSVYAFSKRILAGFTAFSVMANAIFYINSASPMFSYYNLNWLFIFSLKFWPWINLVLLVILVFVLINNLIKKNARTKKN